MASIKIRLNKNKTLSNGEHPIVVQIIISRKKKVLYLGKSSFEAHWNAEKGIPNSKHPNSKMLRLFLNHRKTEYEQKLLELERMNPNPTLSEFLDLIQTKKVQESFFTYFDKIIEMLLKSKKNGNANAYKSTRSVFSKFLKHKDLTFDEVNYKLIKKFETHLLAKGLNVNGISFHMRTLRALYNRAIKDGVANKDSYPFNKYSIKREKTIHRALTKEEVSAVKNFNPQGDQSLQLAKDYFMFSFYNRGMNFIDIAYLKNKNIHKGRLQYKRAKTGTHFTIKLVPPALEIIERYTDQSKPEAFIFPAVQNEERKFADYKNAMRLTNKKLNKIGELTNCSIPLTTYVARHSWATIAKRGGVSTSVISEGMGHATEHITQVYLDSFENKVIDDANQQIVDLI